MTVTDSPTALADARRQAAGGAECAPAQGRAGTSTGINVEPGSADDGWVVPPPVTLADGTVVQLYKDGEALHAAFEAIGQARHRVCLESYIFADDPTGRAVADLLCERARAGVGVYVIYDSFGSHTLAALWRAKAPLFGQMRRAGVRLQEFHPIRPWEGRYSWRPANRDHRKLLVVDDVVAGMGGLNVGREYAGSWIVPGDGDDGGAAPCDPWRDTAVGVRGPGARALLRAFARTWNYCVHGGRIKNAEYLHNVDAAAGVVRADHGGEFGLLASVPTRCSPLRPLLCRLIREATRSVEMTMAYFAPDDDLVDALTRAGRRGVRVRLVLPARSDVHALIVAAQSYYERLMDAGVEVYERQGAILHAKTLVVDRRTAVVGSANLDTRSIEYNLELSAVIRSPAFGQQVHALFENDVRYSRRIDPAAWRRRPWRDRLGQWAVSRARYLL